MFLCIRKKPTNPPTNSQYLYLGKGILERYSWPWAFCLSTQYASELAPFPDWSLPRGRKWIPQILFPLHFWVSGWQGGPEPPVIVLAGSGPLCSSQWPGLSTQSLGVHFKQQQWLICWVLDAGGTLPCYSCHTTCLQVVFLKIHIFFPLSFCYVSVELHFYVSLINADSGLKQSWWKRLGVRER